MKKQEKKDTSWENSAEWYDDYLGQSDTYQAKVILPNLIRLVALKKGETVLDIACGQGYFTKHFADSGAHTTGIDASTSLVEKARQHVPRATFSVSDSTQLPSQSSTVDVATCVLALQNIEHLAETFKEIRRVIRDNGRFIFVINHPAFRIPKHSDWEYSDEQKIQYRRIGRYLSQAKIKIEMHPGTNKLYTWSFHRSLQDFMKALHNAGFTVSQMEEWISHKKSEAGPRSAEEDRARKEIPLFLAVEAVPIRSENRQ